MYKLCFFSLLSSILFLSTSFAIPQCESVKKPFLKNIGQAPDHVQYYIETPQATVFMNKEGEINYNFAIKEHKGSFLIKEKLINAKPTLSAKNPQNVQVNVIKGKNKDKWHKNIPTYSTLSFGQPWQGIEMKIASRPDNIEKIFTLHPQADVNLIKLSLEGHSDLSKNNLGQLQISTSSGNFAFTQPVAWQIIDNERRPVQVGYTVENNQYGFELGDYNKNKELFIDPLLASTYIGGGLSDFASNMFIAENDDVILTGSTDSLDFPNTPGLFDDKLVGSFDLVALKFNKELCTLIAATYFGGSGSDVAHYSDMDADGNIIYVGTTSSTDLPMPDLPYQPFQGTLDANGTIMTIKLSADFTESLGATYLGGNVVDLARGMKLASNGNVYIHGFTNSADYPYTSGAFEDIGEGAIISVLNPDLSELLYSTRLGGGDNHTMVLDEDNSVFVAGTKNTVQDYTVTPGTYLQTPDGGFAENIYMAHLSADLSTLNAATFIARGVPGNIVIIDDELLVAVEQVGTITLSDNAFDDTQLVGGSTTIFKMDKALTTISEATYLDLHNGPQMLPDTDGSIIIFGSTSSFDFPGGNSPSDPTDGNYNGGSSDFVVARLSADFTQVSGAAYIGGADQEIRAIALVKDSSGNIVIAGNTRSNNIETTTFGFDRQYHGNVDIILQKLSPQLSQDHVKSDVLFCNGFENPVGCFCQ